MSNVLFRLKYYQEEAIRTIEEAFTTMDRQFVEMPTGSGKTITFLSYAKNLNKRTLIIVPSRQILSQVYDSALNFFDKSQISRRGGDYKEEVSFVHICIINSIRCEYRQHLSKIDFGLVIIDEAHRSQAESYIKFIDAISLINSSVKFLGVTATPDRLDGKLLNEILHRKSYSISIDSLIHSKYLSDIEGFSVKSHINISNIDTHNGDFSITQLYDKLNTDSRNEIVIDICKNKMFDRKTLVFCVNIAHSQHICDLLNRNGVKAMHIDGMTPENKRKEILCNFRSGLIKVLCNCQLLTEGFDEPSIDGIVLARPTRSKSLFIQMIGRGLRLSPNKDNCRIVDIVDIHKKLMGFNNIVSDEDVKQIERFNKLEDIESHVKKELLLKAEYSLVKTNILGLSSLNNILPTNSMKTLLKDNPFIDHLTFDDASFLIWIEKLKGKHE